MTANFSAIGYARVSSRQDEASLALQREVILTEARKRGWTVDEMVEEVATSPDIERLLAFWPTRIIVAKLDRLSRNVGEIGRVVDRIESWGGVLVSADGLDTGTPAGRMALALLSESAAEESRRIVERKRLKTNADEPLESDLDGDGFDTLPPPSGGP